MKCEQSQKTERANSAQFRVKSWSPNIPFGTRLWALKILPIFTNKRNYSKLFTKTSGMILVCISIISTDVFSAVTPVTGKASFYGNGEKLNRHTASGDVFYPDHLTAASYHFKIGTYVSCTSQETKKSVTVLVNDLGPNKRLNRLIDLSKGAFRLIDDPKKGLVRVSCQEVL